MGFLDSFKKWIPGSSENEDMLWGKEYNGKKDEKRQDYLNTQVGYEWLWKQQQDFLASDPISRVTSSQGRSDFFNLLGAQSDSGARTAQMNSEANLLRSGLSQSGVGGLMQGRFDLQRSMGSAAVESQANIAHAQASAGIYGSIFGQQLAGYGQRMGGAGQIASGRQQDAAASQGLLSGVAEGFGAGLGAAAGKAAGA
jgi:hypothetical protein